MMAKFFQNIPDKKNLPDAVNFLLKYERKHQWQPSVSMPDLNSALLFLIGRKVYEMNPPKTTLIHVY